MSTTVPLPDLLTIEQAAAYLGVRYSTAAMYAREGLLPTVLYGRRVRLVRRADLLTFIPPARGRPVKPHPLED